MPVTAVGKIYKPALRRLAAERRIGEALAPLAADGLSLRAEAVEEGGTVSVRIHARGARDRAAVESAIAAALRDYAIERRIVWA
jgi:fatty-acyl-CoA synthase